MKANNDSLTSIDAIMDAEFGKPGTPERENFRKEAYAYCMGQIICEARKNEKMTQAELAQKIGTNKSYISRIEKGLIDPSISTFCRIIEALGLKLEIVKPLIE
ncbi:helix-turn-helix transcriptional regulator [uncultured Bacteroides sp.]|uniref:helix-turn-helix transcriptional regulator n=1 Tax=uncultured Bacteroides sp. TaxID=162156 RepID=UPI0026087412|nr:helix-turn-helix transcriptional regulator [uncultured Bacteroides sp.]